MAGPEATKKSAAPTPVAKNRKTQMFEYSELNKISLTSTSSFNLYGVIIDATFPHKVGGGYICSLKIIDPSLHQEVAKAGDNDFASVVIASRRFEDLPIAHRVGDILRLHRATVRIYKGQRQFCLNTWYNGSWVLFNAEDTAFAPDSCSGRKYTFEKHESALLGSLRKWVGQHFGSHDGVTKDLYRPLSEAKKATGDFDVVAKILSIHEMDEYTNELKLSDGGGAWFTLALKLKFPHLRAGQVVRIRSATYDETSAAKNVLALSHLSNIMTFVSSSKLASGLKVTDDWKSDAAELNKEVPSHAILLSEVDKKHADMPVTSLYDLFHKESSLSGSTFRTTFSVVKVEGDVHDMTRVYDKKTKKSSSAKGATAGELMWQVSMLCKDASTAGNSNKYIILVHSHEGLGANFFGKAANLWSDAA
jgi:hypothetical protein